MIKVQRYVCRACGVSVSVLPTICLPYRPLLVERLQSFLDQMTGLGSGPDPPPSEVEKGSLERAWARFLTRVDTLKTAFGQKLPATIRTAKDLWREVRRCYHKLGDILLFLANGSKISLLGDYRCLRPPGPN